MKKNIVVKQDTGFLPVVAPGEAGYGLGIAGFTVSFFFGLIGLILSAVALSRSKTIGRSNPLAFVGVIVGIVQVVMLAVGFAIGFAIFASFINSAEKTNSLHGMNGQEGIGHNRVMPPSGGQERAL